MFKKIKQLVMTQFTVCPKTGRITGLDTVKKKAFWLWIILGIAAVVWVVIRVVPKPSRATYPCQKVAQPIAAGFLTWLIGLTASTMIVKRARQLVHNRRYMTGLAMFVVAILIGSFSLMSDTRAEAKKAKTFTPTDAANTPVGTAKGINPGRVAWVYNNKLCDQQSTSGFWWDDKRTDPEVAQLMMAQAIVNLTGITNPDKAWDSLFRYFNKERYGEENRGYQAGDKIAIKVNNIFSRTYAWPTSQDNRPCPQTMYALVWQLVNMAGVPEEDITFYDCIFYHGDPVYDYVYKDFPGVRWAEGDATDRSGYEDGPGDDPGTREKVVRDPECVIHFGDPELIPGSGEVCLPTVVSEAKYVMSIGLPRPHSELAGITCCAKNFFGSVWHPTVYDYYHHWQPMFMHESVSAVEGNSVAPVRAMGTYNALVDLMGHEDLGGKTILCLVECIRYKYWSVEPFNGGCASSIFMSQDFVAIESVMLDFLRSEGAILAGTADNYLHEAAQADNPPSGIVYDPENDGSPLKSLGVHEHWNNSTDRQYTRNLGTGEGIELVDVINDTTHYKASTPAFSPVSGRMQENFILGGNYPNPFRTSTTIRYTLPVEATVSVNIYNLNGQVVATLASNQHMPASSFELDWNGNDRYNQRNPGVYVCSMEVKTEKGTFRKSKQMLMVE